MVPPLAMNQPPVAADDFITMRPGRKVALDVVLNDSDPDGGQLALVKDGFNGPAEMAPTITPKGRIIITSPQEPGIATMSYTVADSFGATAMGNIRMMVTPDAPLKAPIARDDRVTAHQTLGKTAVEVMVLDNDEDPDGIAEDLDIKIAAAPGSTAADATVTAKGTVRIQLAPEAQMVPYTLTDRDGLVATAVIWVPGHGKQYPVLAKTDVIKVTAGQSAVMKLSEYVKVRDGRTPRLTEASKITLIGATKNKDKLIAGDGAGVNYAADLAFFGPGSITFEVTDGGGPDDPDGLKSTLTVLTEVAPALDGAKNTPPSFTGASIDVPQAEETSYDVAPLAKDKDPGDSEKLSFKLVGAIPSGFKAALKGSVLDISASKETKVGVKGTLQVSVSDGANTPVTADVVLVATSSSKPLPVANQDVVSDAHAGRAEVVRVLENDVNPFPDTPLRIVGAQVETGGQGVTATSGTDTVTVTTSPDYKGTVVVKYTVEDKTRDIARVATGRIKMVVKGKPDAPAKPQIVEEKDKAVLISWDSPADNGSPITGYERSIGVEGAKMRHQHVHHHGAAQRHRVQVHRRCHQRRRHLRILAVLRQCHPG
ncbi:Ig-like domain-containing protein [Arthrobacter alpinus]|nr:Ig-like domain-containing protein [Arthrobacter alpinus]